MKKIVFVAPYFLPTTVRFIQAVASVEGAHVGLISCDHVNRLNPKLKARLAGWERVGTCFDAGQVAIATRKLMQHFNGCDALFGALEELQVPLARVRDHLGIDGMNGEIALNFRDKGRMKDALRAAGVPCARHCKITDPSQAWTFVEEVGFPLVIKPPAGAGARSTFQVNDGSQLRDYLAAFAPSSHNPAQLEEFIKGDEFSFEAVSVNGEVKWHSLTRYYPSPLEVLKKPWIQWCVMLPREIDDPRFDEIRRINQAALKALGMGTGLSHMEWFRRQDGSVAVSEVGARPPGAQIMSLTSYGHDHDFYNVWARVMIFGTVTPLSREYASGVAFLRGMGAGRVKAVHGLEQAQKEVGEVVIEAKLPEPGKPKRSGYEGEGYVIVRHRETEQVKHALRRLISLIRVEYA